MLKGMTKTPFTKTPPTLAGDFWSNLQMYWACVACKGELMYIQILRWFHRYIYAHTNLYLVYSYWYRWMPEWMPTLAYILILHCKGMEWLILLSICEGVTFSQSTSEILAGNLPGHISGCFMHNTKKTLLYYCLFSLPMTRVTMCG